MMVKINAIIAIVLILLIINIRFKYHENYEEFYEISSDLNQFYKFKNIPTIIPLDYYYSNDEYEDEINYQKYEFEKLFFNNNLNIDQETMNECYLLFNKFMQCLSKNNGRPEKCQKLVNEKEVRNCEMNFTNSVYYFDDSIEKIKEMKDNFVHFNFPNDDNLEIDIQFGREQIFEDEINMKTVFMSTTFKEEEEKFNNFNIHINEVNNNKEEEIYFKKDCVEYGLTKDEYIICTKYE